MENLKILDETINFFKICKDKGIIDSKLVISNLLKLKKELEEYEQNFKQKEFEYRTNCQNLVSAARVEADNMPDRLAELEKVILDYYLAKGYKVGVGEWGFNINFESIYKFKILRVIFWDKERKINLTEYEEDFKTTKEMFDETIEYFSIIQNNILDQDKKSQNKCDTCKYIFATCKGNNQVFGDDGTFNDAVLECESYLFDNEKRYINKCWIMNQEEKEIFNEYFQIEEIINECDMRYTRSENIDNFELIVTMNAFHLFINFDWIKDRIFVCASKDIKGIISEVKKYRKLVEFTKDLEHYMHYTTGLLATDKPKLIPENLANNFFKLDSGLKPIESPKEEDRCGSCEHNHSFYKCIKIGTGLFPSDDRFYCNQVSPARKEVIND